MEQGAKSPEHGARSNESARGGRCRIDKLGRLLAFHEFSGLVERIMIGDERISISFVINGDSVSMDVDAGETALVAIRDRLGLKGTKEGCGMGECGACTIVVDGRAVNACLLPAAQLDGRDVLTVEGLDSPLGLHPLQEALVEHHAVQCGFCTPGFLMSAYALLKRNPFPSRDEILHALSGNLCRCTGYEQLLKAVEAASQKMNPGR